MRIVFSKVFSDPAEPYVRKRLERVFGSPRQPGPRLDRSALNQLVANILEHQIGTSVPIALPKDHYQITAAQEAEIEARKRCALAALLRESPLLKGEKIQEDFFTFLQEPFGPTETNTAVLRRTTNMSEIFYVFDDVRVVAGNLAFAKPAVVQKTAAPRVTARSKASALSAASIAKSLGGALVSGIVGKIGGLIFESIFPSGVPTYFDEVYKEIKKIVKQELTQESVSKINGHINGVVIWMKTTYIPRKKSKAPRAELYQMLSRQLERINDATGILLQPNYIKPGLPVFMVGAGVHLGLMQELALVDPENTNPLQSSYAKTIKLTAAIYASAVENTLPLIIAERKKAVIIESAVADYSTDPTDSPSVNIKQKYRYKDTIDGPVGNYHPEYRDKDKNYHSGIDEAEADRQRYLPSVVWSITQNLGDPFSTAKQWRMLIDKPIPNH